jgi:hypothetical protein
MTTATVTYTLPTKRPFAADFSHVIIALSVNGGADWTDIGNIPVADPPTVSAANLVPGNWIARGILYDVNGLASPEATEAFVIPDNSGPDAIENLTVALS